MEAGAYAWYILPVTIAWLLNDRVEDMEGIEGGGAWPDHPILRSLNWDAACVRLQPS